MRFKCLPKDALNALQVEAQRYVSVKAYSVIFAMTASQNLNSNVKRLRVRNVLTAVEIIEQFQMALDEL
ncbi:hypothetical protein [Thiomicrorhabdus sp. Kp2]|uniref:hypothetical protein n=1 Tax=Thiomicrorhabdus sp. Kp2 TaxID=1123518 RepID=UPI0005942ED7|nr:hypothetical protein [Thiomicrorhabdus sp. Kp2]